MSRAVRVRAGDVDLVADVRDTPTGDALWMLLPISGRAARWGDEFYFRVDAMMSEIEDDATDVLEIGDIGFWVQGRAIAIFFGPTPASRSDEPRAVTKVNVVGRIRDHATSLKRLDDGVVFHIEAVSPV